MPNHLTNETRERLAAFYSEPGEETFLPLYETTRNLVYTLCYRILRNEEDAGDAFQSTYCRLVSAARSGSHERAARDRGESVYRLAVREAQNLRRRRHRRAGKETTMELRSVPDARCPTDELVADRLVRERIETLVSTLPERYRLPVLLHYLHGLSYSEIARVLDRPVGTISSSIKRALRKLDPLMRRAGLAESAGVLTAIAAGAQLLSPPPSLRGADVFASADAALSAGSAMTTRAAATGSSLSTTLLGTFVGAGIVNAKTAVIAGVIVVAAIGTIGVGLLDSDRDAPAPSGAVSTAPAADPVDSLAQNSEAPEIPVAAVLPPRDAPETRSVNTTATGPVLTGVVRDLETGEPITGAEVRYTSRYAAVTDETGTYVLKDLIGRQGAAGRELDFKVSASGYVFESVRIDLSGGVDTTRNFELEPGADVLVRVVDTEGRPLEGAKIGMLLAGRYHVTDYETDSSGTVLVGGNSRREPRELFAEKDGYAGEQNAKPLFRQDETTPEVTLVLEAFRAEVGYYAGRITDSSGDPLPGIEVLGAYADKTNLLRSESVKTDDEGRYLLALENPDHEFDVYAGGRGFAPQHRPDVPPGTEQEPAEIDFVLGPGHWIEGSVVSQAGEPLEGVRIQVNGIGEDGYRYNLFGESGRATTDGDGHFRTEGAPSGNVYLYADAEGFTSFGEEFEVDQQIRIVLDPEGVIRGRVVDAASGEPVEDFTLKKDSDEYRLAWRAGEAVHSPEGHFVIEGLEYGKRYIVRIDAAHFLPAQVDDAVAVSRDEAEEITVELDRGRPLVGRVIDAASEGPLSGVPVVYAFVSDSAAFQWGGIDALGFDYMLSDVQRTETGSDGSFEFLESADRRGSVLVKAPGYRPVRIDPERRAGFTSGGDLAILLERAGSISGILYFRGAPRAGAAISTWDGRVGYGPVTTDAEGFYRLDGTPPGVYKVRARIHPDSLTRRIELTGREEKRVNIGEDLGPLSIEGRTLHDDGRPLQEAFITVQPKIEWDYVEFQTVTDAGGTYRVEGLVPGTYEVRAAARVHGEHRAIYRTLDVQGNVEEDFIFSPSHRVTARIVFPSGTPVETVSRFSGARLQAVTGAAGRSDLRERSIDTYVSSKARDGVLSFQGRFEGEYRLTLEFERNAVEASLEFPQPITLDNLEGDQDLGALGMPSAGWVDLSLDYDSRSGRLPEYAYLYLFPRGAARTQENATAVGLRPPERRQQLGPLVPGTYDCSLTVWGFQCAPAWTQVTVRPGAASSLDIRLKPEGMIHSVIQIGEMEVPLKRVTLKGPGVDRVLVRDPAGRSRSVFDTLGVYEDWTDGLQFTFHNLPGGSYELTVEVEGYRLWRGTRTVVPGDGKREDITPVEGR